MNKLLLILILSVVSSSAMAEWVEVSSSEERGVTAYANPATILKKYESVKMWTMHDYKIAKGDADSQIMSTQQQQEYECEEVQSRTNYIIAYPKNMGQGEAVFSGNVSDDWKPVSPDSIDEELWKLACGK